MTLPSAHHIKWLEDVAKTTQRSGQPLVAARFREIAKALQMAEISAEMANLSLKAVLKVDSNKANGHG